MAIVMTSKSRQGAQETDGWLPAMLSHKNLCAMDSAFSLGARVTGRTWRSFLISKALCWTPTRAATAKSTLRFWAVGGAGREEINIKAIRVSLRDIVHTQYISDISSRSMEISLPLFFSVGK